MRTNYPKKNEAVFDQARAAFRNMAPETKFKGKTLADFSVQVGRSLASRQRLLDLANQTTEELATREAEDERSLEMLADMIDGVVGHEDFGKDSALYEALGFVRKSQRKSGLTRKRKKKEVTPMP